MFPAAGNILPPERPSAGGGAGIILCATHPAGSFDVIHELAVVILSFSVFSVSAENSVSPQSAANHAAAVGASQRLCFEAMGNLIATQFPAEFAVEVSLRDEELHMVLLAATVFASRVNVQLQFAGIVVGHVRQNRAGHVPGVEHDDFGAVFIIIGPEGQLLGLRIVGELAFGSRSVLGQLRSAGAVAVLDVQRFDFLASSTSGHEGRNSFVVIDGQVIGEGHRSAFLGFELAASLHFGQTSRNQTVRTGNGNGLVALQGAQLPSALTSDVLLFLRVRNGSVLQFVQDKCGFTIQLKSGNGVQRGQRNISNIPLCSIMNLLLRSAPFCRSYYGLYSAPQFEGVTTPLGCYLCL